MIDVLRDRGVDGIIHAAVLRSDPAIARAVDDGMPVVTLNRKVDGSPIPSIVNDDDAGICQMLRHLRDLGHTRIAHISGPQDLSTGQLRLAAFLRAADDMNVTVNNELIEEASRFDEAEGARCLLNLLAKGKPFTAVLCANDRLALGAIEGLRERNVGCPEQISVTGFNDMPFLNLIQPELTTIRIQQFGAGKAAASILLQLLNRDGTAPRETVLPVELVVRKSTGPAHDATAMKIFI
ncbi:DNA-binding LacI/PurR family transcriptional regulator [Rhizobium mesoamericanum]|nr:DNA-binding LacI/PurR family transcriptional regulator [Rhizobium mesoamericanum]